MSRIGIFGSLVLTAFLAFSLSLIAQQKEPTQTYAARRSAIRDKLKDCVLVLFGNSEAPGSEAYFAFRQESNFYYLTGLAEPGAALLLAPQTAVRDADQPPGSDILFLAPRPKEEFWNGPQLDATDPEAAQRTGFAVVKDVSALEGELRRYASSGKAIYTLLPDSGDTEAQIALTKEHVERLKEIVPSLEVRDARKEIASLREVKSPGEVALIRRAIDCTIDGILAAGREVKPGIAEYEVAAVMKYTFERSGCTVTGFDPIVGSGPRSTILHYIRNSEKMSDGDLVVLDVGSEYGDYSADISRTLPVNGHFTPRQREIYQIVLGAQQAAIDAVRPGIRLSGRGTNSLYQIAVDYLNSHGKDKHGEQLGKYFMHGLGHGVGLDVHDTLTSPILQPGMVVTIEPGLYLPEENIGVRIEDMILVTENGGELLTRRLPRAPNDVEKLMQRR